MKTIRDTSQALLVGIASCAFLCAFAFATVVSTDDPKTNYILNCQGCHLAGGEGTQTANARVPALRGYIGNFLQIEGGRSYLIRVPGSANAPLDNRQLADLLNWIMIEFSGDSFPGDFVPFSEQEVASLRGRVIQDVVAARAEMIGKIRGRSGTRSEEP